MNFCTLHASFLLAHGGKVHSDLLYRNVRVRRYRLLDVEHFDDNVLLAGKQSFLNFDCQLKFMKLVHDASGLSATAVRPSADQS